MHLGSKKVENGLDDLRSTMHVLVINVSLQR